MKRIRPKHRLISALSLLIFLFASSPHADETDSLLAVTPAIRTYATQTVDPMLTLMPDKDKLSLLIRTSEILNDPQTGISVNRIKPSYFMIYDKLEQIGLGFLVLWFLSPEQGPIVREWRGRFMGANPADVFFRQSADDIIRTRAAFGCSHYARTFISIVKALNLIEDPEAMLYAISTKADDYNRALNQVDANMTLNGHQFVLVRLDGRWLALNPSKAESVPMPRDFSPRNVRPPRNIPVRFPSYPGIVLLLRKVGRDHNDGCRDDTLENLMNIYRSGDAQDNEFKWDRYDDAGNSEAPE